MGVVCVARWFDSIRIVRGGGMFVEEDGLSVVNKVVGCLGEWTGLCEYCFRLSWLDNVWEVVNFGHLGCCVVD